MQFARRRLNRRRLRREAGTWLKELRGRAGLSQIELAEILGLKYYTFISQVENGFGRVPTESMEAWAQALRSEPSEFAKHAAVLLRPGTPPAAVRGEEMNVVAFPSSASRCRRHWQASELNAMLVACRRAAGQGGGDQLARRQRPRLAIRNSICSVRRPTRTASLHLAARPPLRAGGRRRPGPVRTRLDGPGRAGAKASLRPSAGDDCSAGCRCLGAPCAKRSRRSSSRCWPSRGSADPRGAATRRVRLSQCQSSEY